MRQLKLQQLSQLTWRLCSTQGDPPPRQQHDRHHHHHDYFHHKIFHHHHYNIMLQKQNWQKKMQNPYHRVSRQIQLSAKKLAKNATTLTGLAEVLST